MMKNSWFFHWWFVLKLKQQTGSTFKVKNEVDAIKTDCISEILHNIEPLISSIKKLAYKLGIKKVQNNRARLHREEHGDQKLLQQPLFTQNQISTITRKYWLNKIVQGLFVTSEGFLFLIVAPVLMPGGGTILKIAVAALLSVLGMVGLDYGFSNHFLYLKIKNLHAKKEAGDCELKTQQHKRILGYLFILLTLAVIIFSGMVRIFFVESVDPSGLTPEKLHTVREASKWSSMLTMSATILIALFLAAQKRELSKIIERFDVLQYWRAAVKRKNTYAQMLIKDSQKVMAIIEKNSQAHWMLVIEIKRIFKMANEYDERYQVLNTEYQDTKSKVGFSMNDFIYRKYAPVQGAHEELFHYGINNAPEIKDKIIYVQKVLREVEEYLSEQVHAANQREHHNNISILAPSQNGKKNEPDLQTL